MNRTKLSKLMAQFNLTGEISGAGKSLSVELANDKDMRKFSKNIAKWGGYKTGYGAWVLSANYTDPGDYMDKCSRHHY